MTTAQTGLAKALARSASGEVIALAELSADDLKASLSAEQIAALQAAPAPAAAADDMPPKKKDGCSDDEDEDDVGGDKDMAGKPGSKAEENSASADTGTQRALAVMASEHFAGRESLAATLLANEKLSADEIVGILSASATAAPALAGDDEATARAAMKEAIAETGNSNVDAGAAPAAKPNNSASVWDQASKINNLTPVQ